MINRYLFGTWKLQYNLIYKGGTVKSGQPCLSSCWFEVFFLLFLLLLSVFAFLRGSDIAVAPHHLVFSHVPALAASLRCIHKPCGILLWLHDAFCAAAHRRRLLIAAQWLRLSQFSQYSLFLLRLLIQTVAKSTINPAISPRLTSNSLFFRFSCKLLLQHAAPTLHMSSSS
jgi:hypothetical protein